MLLPHLQEIGSTGTWMSGCQGSGLCGVLGHTGACSSVFTPLGLDCEQGAFGLAPKLTVHFLEHRVQICSLPSMSFHEASVKLEPCVWPFPWFLVGQLVQYCTC